MRYLHLRSALIPLNNGKEDRITRKEFRILLVDNDPDTTLTLKTGLEKNGFRVDVFNDPLEVLLNYKRHYYNLLILDIKMPRMSGFELYNEIEKNDKNVKVCFITSFVTYYESLMEIFPTVKVNCFIKKPIEIDNLVKRINRELEFD